MKTKQATAEITQMTHCQRKIKSIYLHQVLSIPGTKINADLTINATKHPGVNMTLSPNENFVDITMQGHSASVPATNVAHILWED